MRSTKPVKVPFVTDARKALTFMELSWVLRVRAEEMIFWMVVV